MGKKVNAPVGLKSDADSKLPNSAFNMTNAAAPLDPAWVDQAGIVAGVAVVDSVRFDTDGTCWVKGDGKPDEKNIGVVAGGSATV